MEFITTTIHGKTTDSFSADIAEINGEGHMEVDEALEVKLISHSGGGLRIDFDPRVFGMVRIYAGRELVFSKGE